MSKRTRLSEDDSIETLQNENNNMPGDEFDETELEISSTLRILKRNIASATHLNAMVGDNLTREAINDLKSALSFCQGAAKVLEESRARQNGMKLYELPDLVLRLMFKYLNFSDLKNLRLVCSGFNEMIKSLDSRFSIWNIDLRMKSNENIGKLSWFLESSTPVRLVLPSKQQLLFDMKETQKGCLLLLLNQLHDRVLCLKGPATLMMPMLAMSNRNKYRIRELHITESTLEETRGLITLLEICSESLTKLSLFNTDMTCFRQPPLRNLVALQQLEVVSSTHIYGLTVLLKYCCPSLTNLYLADVKFTASFADYLREIKHVTLLDCKGQEKGFHKVLKFSKYVEQLKIIRTDLTSLPVFLYFPNLKKLELGDLEESVVRRLLCDHVNSEKLESLVLHGKPLDQFKKEEGDKFPDLKFTYSAIDCITHRVKNYYQKSNAVKAEC